MLPDFLSVKRARLDPGVRRDDVGEGFYSQAMKESRRKNGG
jgi:hypothetical protein